MSELKENKNHKAFGDHVLKRKITKIKYQLKKNKSSHAG